MAAMNEQNVGPTVEKIVIDCLRDLAEDVDASISEELDRETRLYGAKSGLDSISLVSLITDVEERVADVFSVAIVLADERAMSQRNSPFRRVGTFCDYVVTLINESGAQ